MTSTIQDGGFAWMVCLASFLSQVVHGGLVFSMGIFFIMFRKGIDAGDGALTFITALNYSICFAVCPLVGVLSTKFGERRPAMFGALLATIGLACSALSTKVYHLYIVYGFIAGIGMGLAYNPSITILAKHFNRHKKIATGLAVCGIGVGSFIFPPIIKVLEETYGWRGALLMVAGIQAQGIVLSGFFRAPEEVRLPPPCYDQRLVGTTVIHDVLDEQTDATVELPLADTEGEMLCLGNDVKDIFSSKWMPNGVTWKGMKCPKSRVSLYQGSTCSNCTAKQKIQQGQQLNSLIMITPSTTAVTAEKAAIKPTNYNGQHRTMCSLFTNVPFISLCLHSMTIQFPIAIVYTHLGNYVLTLGFGSRDVVLLYMVMGITMTLTRALMGIVAEFTWAKPSVLVIPCALINGGMTILLPFALNLSWMYAYAVLMPMLLAPYTIFIISMDSVPIGLVPLAFGVVCFVRVPAIAFGAPIAALLCEVTQLYASSFYLAGSLFLMAGIVMVPQAFWKENCRKQRRETVEGLKEGKLY